MWPIQFEIGGEYDAAWSFDNRKYFMEFVPFNEDQYEEIEAQYQCLEIDRLNNILKSSGIEDTATRRRICSEYFYSSGHFLYSGWFKVGETTIWPELCYSERQLDGESSHGQIKRLYLNSGHIPFYQGSGGAIEWYFVQAGENAREIVCGGATWGDDLDDDRRKR